MENEKKCICCGSLEQEVFIVSKKGEKSFKIFKCKKCGLFYSNSISKWDNLKDVYSNYEIPYQWEYGSDFFNRKITTLVSSVTPPGGKVLEVGCGYGKILADLEKKGFEVVGVEASSCACEHIRREYNFPVYEGMIETYLDSFSNQSPFNTIVALNVIEHLRNPYETLRKFNRILIQGGYVVIIVPDVALALLFGKIKKLLHKPDPYGIESGSDKGPIAFNSPGHLFFFSRKTLRALIERVGWEVIEHKHAPYVLSGGRSSLKLKDLLKPYLYYLVRAGEIFRIGSTGLSYSQLLLAKKIQKEL